MNIRTFYPSKQEHRDRYRYGILVTPLPDAEQILGYRIYKALKHIGVSSTGFSITDPTSVSEWCKAVGIQDINSTSLLGVWTDKDPETCIQIVREIVAEHLSHE